MDTSKTMVENVPIWIRLVGLDLKYWGQRALTKIAGLIGKPIKTDSATKLKERLVYARVMVEVPMNKTYPEFVMFENERGQIVEQQVQYEWKPILCPHCKNFGHNAEVCRKWLKEPETLKKLNSHKKEVPKVADNELKVVTHKSPKRNGGSPSIGHTESSNQFAELGEGKMVADEKALSNETNTEIEKRGSKAKQTAATSRPGEVVAGQVPINGRGGGNPPPNG
ncbi:uncharacterized protein LOC132624535 [Lycium barbarum]|uniref:uncharacterized protein LOC132624535 n=1 Tax=Lycium barbarum TaxID=112863 RepID=UPI00293E3693|nr:uncharacterized protein LOC132624535 [Lycium barbarum]